jgi:hypothetical protein
MIGMAKPIKIALIAAVPMEIIVLGFALQGAIKGPPSGISLVNHPVCNGAWIMHWSFRYLGPLVFRMSDERLAFSLAALTLCFIGYLDCVLLIAAILYGYRAAAH